MNVIELETAIADLSPRELMELAAWFEEFVAQVWDRQIEEDLTAYPLRPRIWRTRTLNYVAWREESPFERI